MDAMRRIRAGSLLLLMLLVGASCATAPPKRLELYPTLGQTAEQLDRDEWECRVWAKKQTGFEPGASLNTGALAGLLGMGLFGGAMGATIGATQAAAGTGAAIGAAAGLGVGAPLGGEALFLRDADSFQRAFRACAGARGYELR